MGILNQYNKYIFVFSMIIPLGWILTSGILGKKCDVDIFKALIFIVQFSYKYLSNLLLHALCLTELVSLYIISAASLSLFVSAAWFKENLPHVEHQEWTLNALSLLSNCSFSCHSDWFRHGHLTQA